MNKNSHRGFTLMETLLSITVVAILLTSFLAVFGPATNSIRQAVSIQDADRLASALEKELRTLNEDEINTFDTAFDKAFEWISNSNTLSSSIVLFNYRGDTSQITDGKFEPYLNTDGSPGQDYLVQSVVRRLDGSNNDLEQLMEAVEGRVFLVRMRQLVPDANGGLTTASAGSGIVDSEGATAASSQDFQDAAIAFQGDFYLLPANTFQYLTGPLTAGGADFDSVLGNPLFTRSMAVRR